MNNERGLFGMGRIGVRRMAATVLAFSVLSGICDAQAGEGTNTATRRLGFYYTNDANPDIPMSVHIVKIERSHPELFFTTTLGRGNVMGMETVPDQVQTLAPALGRPIAAINGDFYDKTPNYLGRPRNVQIRQGELVSSPSGHCAFWLDPAGAPHMTNVFSRFAIVWPNGRTNILGLNEARSNNCVVLYTAAMGPSTHTTGGVELVLEGIPDSPWLPLKAGGHYQAKVRSVHNGGDTPIMENQMVLSIDPAATSAVGTNRAGDIIRFSTETTPDLTGVEMVLGGGPSLVENGKPIAWTGLIVIRHPRTAVGWNKDYFFMVEVDGRQSDVSLGMSLSDLAEYMAKIGCESAMNLDGGGSSTLWFMGRVMNSPSEGRERPAANALVLLRKTPQSP